MNSSYKEMINLACPVCKSILERQSECYFCGTCNHQYTCTAGIPDLRPPTDTTSTDEHALVGELLEKFSASDFQEMALSRVRTRRTTDQRKRKFANYNITIKERSAKFYAMFKQRIQQHWRFTNHRVALDIGCGIGPGILALSKEYDLVVGLDIHLSALIVAQKMIEEEGLDNVVLVQGSAVALPFVAEQFDYVMAINVLEHIFVPDVVMEEVHRTMAIDGLFGADSRNRFDPFFPEPHVGLRWLGFLPRRWMEPYVRWRMNVNYDHTYLLSYWDLKRAATRSFGSNWRIVLPDIAAYGGGSSAVRRLVERASQSDTMTAFVRHLSPTHLIFTRRTALAGAQQDE